MASRNYKKNREQGLCGWCGREAENGFAYCKRCLEIARKADKKRSRDPKRIAWAKNYKKKLRNKYKVERKCIRCYRPLDADWPYKKCQNCSERLTGKTLL